MAPRPPASRPPGSDDPTRSAPDDPELKKKPAPVAGSAATPASAKPAAPPADEEDDDEDDEAAAQREFARAPSSRSLHDVALAPPTITARPKERRPTSTRPKPSPARQRILDEERQRVIELYRAQKRA
mgnify:CR=1 FL=1